MDKISLSGNVNAMYVGIYFKGECPDFFKIECPCGVISSFPVNGLPTVTTPHPCGKPDHWTVKYED